MNNLFSFLSFLGKQDFDQFNLQFGFKIKVQK